MVSTLPQTLTLEMFLAQYGADPRYELIDGELRDREPTGPHEAVAGKGAAHLGRAVLASDRPWIIPRTCLITPPAAGATALRPDVVLLDETGLALEPLWQREPKT